MPLNLRYDVDAPESALLRGRHCAKRFVYVTSLHLRGRPGLTIGWGCQEWLRDGLEISRQ